MKVTTKDLENLEEFIRRLKELGIWDEYIKVIDDRVDAAAIKAFKSKDD